MKRVGAVVTLFSAFLALFGVQDLWAIPAPPKKANLNPGLEDLRIRVRVSEPQAVVAIRGFDLRLFDGVDSSRRLVTMADRLSEWELQCRNGKVKATPIHRWNAERVRDFEVAGPISIESPAGFLTLKNRPYREEIRVFPVGRSCEIVNAVELEKYLDGLVNAEFNSRWSEESIAAQIVAARTYALNRMIEARKRKHARFDVDSTEKDQVYDGSIREDFRASRAVQKTRGLVLMTGAGAKAEPLKAFYHSTCGGVTELPERVWGKPYPGFKHTARCPYCVVSPRYRWEVKMHHDEVAHNFAAGAKKDGGKRDWPKNWRQILDQGELLEVKPGQEGYKQRALQVETLWRMGNQNYLMAISSSKFRSWMGSAFFRSTSFQATPIYQGNYWLFEGRGSGHGVGMCQWGAKVMGEKGFKMASILKLYYPDAVLRKLW